jgi:hypothetical protein
VARLSSFAAQELGIESLMMMHQDNGMDGKAASAARSTRQSIMAYLDGQETLDWILRVINSGGDAESLRQFIRDLKGYGDPQRRDQLLNRLGDAA